ncbi:MAG TPA: 50S ribosomal protein L13 [bacterium]|nr:50S ribosomal protein L13 [bacterium]
MKTYSAKPTDVIRKWYVVDASQYPLGRMSTRVADILRGKHKAMYTPHMDTGDFVVVINASKVVLTGKKATTKEYKHYTGFPGGLRYESFETMIKKNPEKVVFLAVKRMLPDNKLSDKVLKKLKVYAGPEHEQAAQKPELLKLA